MAKVKTQSNGKDDTTTSSGKRGNKKSLGEVTKKKKMAKEKTHNRIGKDGTTTSSDKQVNKKSSGKGNKPKEGGAKVSIMLGNISSEILGDIRSESDIKCSFSINNELILEEIKEINCEINKLDKKITIMSDNMVALNETVSTLVKEMND